MKLFIYILTIGLLTGCGGNSQGSNDIALTASEASGIMEVNKLYVMHHGDRVLKETDDAIIQVIHTNSSKDAAIKLLTGKAKIIRKS